MEKCRLKLILALISSRYRGFTTLQESKRNFGELGIDASIVLGVYDFDIYKLNRPIKINQAVK